MFFVIDLLLIFIKNFYTANKFNLKQVSFIVYTLVSRSSTDVFLTFRQNYLFCQFCGMYNNNKLILHPGETPDICSSILIWCFSTFNLQMYMHVCTVSKFDGIERCMKRETLGDYAVAFFHTTAPLTGFFHNIHYWAVRIFKGIFFTSLRHFFS